ncbi:MAG: prolyl oligopeptidase family serine peptidase [Gemmatimonadaceae bacterium]
MTRIITDARADSRTGAQVLGALLLAAVLATPTASAQTTNTSAGRALTIEDFYVLKTVGSPQLSPDGRWVAYTVSTHVETTNADRSEVWLVAADGAVPARRVSSDGVNATGPRWSDDGRLRFNGDSGGWVVDPAAPDRVVEGERIPTGPGGGARTALTSPDGKWVASLRALPPTKRERVFASDFEKRHEERFKGVQFDWLDFQRDGQTFPVPNRVDPEVNPPQEVFLAPTAGTGDRQLTRVAVRPAGLQWHRDGSRLLFTADSGYRNELRYGSNEIYLLSTDGALRKLTSDRDYNYTNAAFSPDGRWILYSRQLSTDAVIAKKLSHGGPTDLVVMPADGGSERLLTADWDFLPSGAQWSPDGKWVYFNGGIGGENHLFRVAAAGGGVEQITRGERRIGGVSFDKGFTRIAYTVGLIESPAEVFVANIDGSGERRLTSVHDSFVRDIALSRAERLNFRSADGTPIEGWLMYPQGYRAAAGPYPLIVSNHGGPHGADGYSFDFKSQYFAANGYFVLKVNFRSSTGYGEKFLWGTWGGWGNKDGQDVMAGIDHAIGRYPIDRSKVATIGHSYGGFMTNWLITQYPDRFAAAIPGAGIVNWVSDYGTADIARTKETEFYGTPWDEKARNIMIRQSPLTYANRVKAPTLFVHGEVDQRVPYSEAEQMFVALKKNGVPARMIQYAGMPHAISGSWNQVHRMLNELKWLDRYLKAGKVS